jgi:hypothetical protein
MTARVRPRTLVASAAVAMAAGMLGWAAPAGAEPVDNPCELAIGLLCRFLPIAPELDHDVDLTVDQPDIPPTMEPPPIPGG